MTRFRQEIIGDCRLILCDCRAVLETLGPVDAVVTDPPYCSGGFSETAKKQAAGMGLRSETIREVGWFTNDNMTTAGIACRIRSMSPRRSGGVLI